MTMKKKDKYVDLRFDFKHGGDLREFIWRGVLEENAPITEEIARALIAHCGFQIIGVTVLRHGEERING